ncbi:tetratricopeptide repeat protein (macronuclear) [Tetrahymena thermophila SB210]|uniref:Tetratricopeptide repeat protein n=1 Tax=Tetrahymena thermophila (strain SB210) TaxID=312017 RepID=Q22R44_TETTS|nr:tetratricopeptide repeat protein [Tetrahymena thermophila SB210]EAR88278.2 tetratricopeptide repeat protein [Tetrahymena thermophila SB210]|eukprot:XP_001008523.2 tetratricopeptide repeat protein [Tetrahymena thermophila SB210]
MGQSQFKKEQQECLELIKNQKFLESLQFLENMENNNNNQVNIREFVSFQKGLCYMGLNKHVQAIECFEKCYDVQSKINICQILMKINKFDKAKSLLQELNRNSENNSLILQLNGSYLLFADKNYQEAAQKFEQSLALNETFQRSQREYCFVFIVLKKLSRFYHNS